MFDPTIPPAAGSKKTVPMVSVTSGKLVSHARPKGDIVAKEHHREACECLLTWGDDRILVGYCGSTVSSPRGLQIRETETFSLVGELEGAGPHLLLSDNQQQLLASGRLFRGYQSETLLVDMPSLTKTAVWPLRKPFVLLPDGRFIAKTPQHNPMLDDGEIQLYSDPELVAAHRHFEPGILENRRLLLVDPAKNTAEPLIDEELAEESGWTEPQHLALSPDGRVLYYATSTDVGAIDLEQRTLIWSRQLGVYDQHNVYSIYALALSPDAQMIAVGGISSTTNDPRNLVVFKVSDGESVLELPLARHLSRSSLKNARNTSIHCLAWHPKGWLAGATSSGVVAHISLNGDYRAYNGAGKGIYGLAFVRQGTALVAGGREKQLRLWPLLDDEI